MDIVFLDGNFLKRSKACISIDDRGFLFGHGVFTTIRVVDGVVENYFMHMQRLIDHARELHIQFTPVESQTVEGLIKLNQAFKGVWRLKIILTAGPSKLKKLQDVPCGHYLMTLEMQTIGTSETYCVADYPYPINGPAAHLKSLSYLNRLCVADYAASRNCDDALVLSPEGWILESSYANLFWRIENHIYTPDPSLPYLKGISISMLEKCVKKLGLEWHTVRIKPDDLPLESQLYLTNAMIGLKPVTRYRQQAYERDLNFEQLLNKSFKNEIEGQSLRI